MVKMKICKEEQPTSSLEAPSTEKFKIRIAWEITHKMFCTELMAYSFWKIGAGMILYARQYPESNAISLDRKILWSWIGIWGAVVVSGLV